MFIPASYSEPVEVSHSKTRSAVAQIWRAESYMREYKMEGDLRKIEWFLRGMGDNVVLWYRTWLQDTSAWAVFKREYILDFGNSDDLEIFLYSKRLTEESPFGYFRSRLRAFRSSSLRGLENLFDIVEGRIRDEKALKVFRNHMWRRPSHISYLNWVDKLAEHRELLVSDDEKEESKKAETRENQVLDVENQEVDNTKITLITRITGSGTAKEKLGRIIQSEKEEIESIIEYQRWKAYKQKINYGLGPGGY
ncbi:hypothetical protein PAEPH01_0484 [Pancytospora epiphaga]|nr:hypothetical protein PAEPH01_0484 [Pancytospora epiphaga]